MPFEIQTVNNNGFGQNEPNEIKMGEFLGFSVKNDQFGKLPLDVLPALGVLSLNERIDIFYRTDTFRYLQMNDIIRFYTAMCSERFFYFLHWRPLSTRVCWIDKKLGCECLIVSRKDYYQF